MSVTASLQMYPGRTILCLRSRHADNVARGLRKTWLASGHRNKGRKQARHTSYADSPVSSITQSSMSLPFWKRRVKNEIQIRQTRKDTYLHSEMHGNHHEFSRTSHEQAGGRKPNEELGEAEFVLSSREMVSVKH